MRDPKRIRNQYCNRLANLWEQVPDWRFAQFCMNMMSDYYSENKRDPFFVEDREFFAFMESRMNKMIVREPTE